ncbi:NYN domain-containing protein [Georgenia sp. 10Sc9-8]|uniref:NYN domain-containing protein n=1 Tax=Georgenia halotolerans TaxID=3028317 RepID=A0ABT5TV81_9MICO|nr:NYN domain-containing protein [Georgenia halotolerans]
MDAYTPQRTVRKFRTALFVDFDNVYSGLCRLDQDAADTFATDPASWVGRLELGSDAEGPFVRRFLIRVCYLNPSTHARFRPFFTRAGFRVVDCPSLTQQGKSSADINLVLDAVDALGATTSYDEFVIASGDADFTPLAHRCRAADRRVSVLTAGPTAGAYRAVADTVVTADELAELVTGSADTDHSAAASVAGDEELGTGDDAPLLEGEYIDDEGAVSAVRALLAGASGPQYSASVAHAAQSASPGLRQQNWRGHGSFGSWLQNRVPGVGYSSKPAPGFVWDAEKYSEADLPLEGPLPTSARLSPLQKQVCRVTDTPVLSVEEFAAVFEALAADIDEHTFHRNETTKRVRDSCRSQDGGVSRAAVNFIVQGLLYAGADLRSGSTAADLGSAFARNVLQLCASARMELDESQVAQIRSWASGGLVTGD